MCLGSAAGITHKAQALTSHAATWHACATINPCDPSMAADAEAAAAAIPPATPTAFTEVPTTTTVMPTVASALSAPLTATAPVPALAPIGTVHWAPEVNDAAFLSVGNSENSSRSICSNSSNSNSRREMDESSDEDDEWALDMDKLMITHTTISYQKRQAIGIAF